jgi:hypothetical protein
LASIIGDSIPPSHRRQAEVDELDHDDDNDGNNGGENLYALPSHEEMELQLDIFLEWQNLSMVMIHTSTLRELLDNYLPQPTSTWDLLLTRSILSLTYNMQLTTATERT